MAATPMMQTSQQPERKERWSTKARKRITAISKGVSEVLAGIAEPGMRYATIYMALATGLPAINYGPLFAFCEGLVIALPEFVLIGAFGIAEDAWKEGKKVWAGALLAVCFALALIVILTLIDIFVVKFPDVDIKYLNFGRCLVAVSFSVILGKLDDGKSEEENQQQSIQPVQNAASLNMQPVQAPIQPVQDERIDVITEEVKRLSALVLQMSQTVNVYVNSQEMDRDVQTHIQEIQEPVQQLPEVAGSIHQDEQEPDQTEQQSASEAPAVIYPEVAGIDAYVVKLVIDERLKGIAWSMVASNLGKNYTRVVKPIKEAYMAICTDVQAE
jgi:hypothetical protein